MNQINVEVQGAAGTGYNPGIFRVFGHEGDACLHQPIHTIVGFDASHVQATITEPGLFAIDNGDDEDAWEFFVVCERYGSLERMEVTEDDAVAFAQAIARGEDFREIVRPMLTADTCWTEMDGLTVAQRMEVIERLQNKMNS